MFDAHALRPVTVEFPPSGIFILESHHTREFRMEPVKHRFLKLLQPFAGAGWLVRGGMRIPLTPADVVLVPAGERHYIEDDGTRPLRLYALCVDSDALPRDSANAFAAYRHFPTPGWSTELRGLFRHLLHEQTLARPGADLMMRGLAWQALAHVIRAASGRKPTAVAPRTDLPTRARVAAYAGELTRTFYHRQTVDGAAANLGLSRRHFTQLFRELTGESWLATVRQHRLAHASRLLRETNRSATSIGYECGFEDITTFYRAFKTQTGTSPLAWRRARKRRP